MNRASASLRRTLALALLAPMPLLSTACEETFQMEIVGVLGPVAPECALDPVETPVLEAGVLDLRATSPRYVAPIVVDPTWNIDLDALRVFFTDVNLRTIDGLASLNHARSHPVEGQLLSGQRQVFEMEIVTADDARTIRQNLGGGLIDDDDTVRVYVWLTFAGRLGELSNELAFPIDVCHGCLIGHGTVDGEVCIDETAMLVEHEVCRAGQDALFSSCEAPED